MAGDTQFRNGRNPMEIADDNSSRDSAAAERKRAESRKPLWERAGMTREEYARGIKQLADERRAEIAREERLARARKGQSNPGN